jgi:hypothetical protein
MTVILNPATGGCQLRRIFRQSQLAEATIATTPAITTTAAASGYFSASTPSAITNPSSERLRIQLVNGHAPCRDAPRLGEVAADASAAPARGGRLISGRVTD